MELNQRYQHALSGDLHQAAHRSAGAQTRRQGSTGLPAVLNSNLQLPTSSLQKRLRHAAAAGHRHKVTNHTLQAVTKRLHRTTTVRARELLRSNQFPHINEKSSEETATNSTTSVLSACKTPPAQPGAQQSPDRSAPFTRLPLLRVPVISLKIV